MSENTNSENRKRIKNKVQSLIDSGAEIAGAALGSALGYFAAGPAGAAAGGAAGTAAGFVLQTIGREASERLLAPRERARVGGVLALVAEEIDRRTKEGEDIRSDGFFDPSPNGRSAAEEVAENILLKAQSEAEEKKLRYYAHLLANIAFDSSVNDELAHQLIKVAESLTYRQLCILHMIPEKNGWHLRTETYRGHGSFGRELYQVLFEIYDLYQRGLINFGGNAALGVSDFAPASMTIQGLGADLYNLMQLAKMPTSDIKKIADQLK